MIAQSDDKSYYAISGETGNEGTTTGGKWASEAKNLVAGSIALANAQTGDTVSCQTSVRVDLSGTMVQSLTKGDVFLTLGGLVTGIENIDLAESETETNQLTYSGNGDEKTAYGTYTGNVSLNGPEQTQNLTADVWLVNKKDIDQNVLAGKELKVKLTIQAQDCKTTSAGD